MTADSGHNPNTAGGPGREDARSRLDPAALAVADLAALLTKAGGVRVRPEQIEADVEAGAPTNADGTLSLVHYAAWLVREMSRGGPTLGS